VVFSDKVGVVHAMTTDVTIRLLRGDPAEMAMLQNVLESAPAYAERVTGAPPVAADAQSIFTILPEGKSYEDKFVFGIFCGVRMIGCIDLIRGYPTPNTTTLELLLVAEQHQKTGFGRLAYTQLEQLIKAWGSCNLRFVRRSRSWRNRCEHSLANQPGRTP
jgi:hypothetical protein